MTLRRIETLEDIAEGLDALARIDPRLLPVIEAAGEIPLRRRQAGFEGLAAIIVAQMVSRASADAIFARLAERAGDLTPEACILLAEGGFKGIGLSRAKERTLHSTALAIAEGALDLEALADLPAEEAVKQMTALKGIGPWTAEVYLLFCLGHPDIFPAGDIALRVAVGDAFAMDARPDIVTVSEIASRWAPWRAVAARLFWAYYARLKGRDALPPSVRPNSAENGR